MVEQTIPKRFEIARQIIHIVLGLATVVLLYFGIISKWFVLGIAIIIAVIFFIRLKWELPIIDKIISKFERPRKRHHYEGPLAFFLGMFAVLFVFEKNTALAGIMIMVLGDSASTIFGRLFGRIRIPWSRKTIIGSVSGIVFGFLGALLFVPALHAIIASFVAMIVESFDKDLIDINDNILMPVSASAVIAVLGFLGA